ncbi:unnamed protein product [Ectocarpus sp. 12 AP-2014]
MYVEVCYGRVYGLQYNACKSGTPPIPRVCGKHCRPYPAQHRAPGGTLGHFSYDEVGQYPYRTRHKIIHTLDRPSKVDHATTKRGCINETMHFRKALNEAASTPPFSAL